VRDAITKGGSVVGNITVELSQLGIARESLVTTGVRFIRRATDLGHDYFLTNLTDHAVNQWVTLGPRAGLARFVDPLTGNDGLAALRQQPGDGATEIFLQLDPGESMLLHTLDETVDVQSALGPWPYRHVAGAAVPLPGEWQVSFLTGGPNLPPPFDTAELNSWTEIGDDNAQSFAGTARYRLEFTLPDDAVADDWLLDLGDVRESARVRLDGRDLATLWSLPFRVRVGAFLQPGTNTLELDVTNLAANRIRDLDQRGAKWRIMREINFVNINYRPFDSSGWDLTPSGLLGPVTLTPLRRIKPDSIP
jgi:hypothetical protein